MFVGKQRDELVLREVDVLILIDEDVAELRLIAHARFVVALEQLDRAPDQIVEIEAVRLFEAAFVFAIDLRVALADERGILRLVGIGRPQVILRFGDLGERGARSDLALVEIEIVQDLANDRALVRIVHDREVRGDPDLATVAAQNAHAHRVERAHPEIARDRADHALQARFHLAGSLVRKGHGEDPVRKDLLLVEQVRDPVREHARFARTGTCEDEDRAIGLFDRSPLYVV